MRAQALKKGRSSRASALAAPEPRAKEAKAWLFAQNEKQYGSGCGGDNPGLRGI